MINSEGNGQGLFGNIGDFGVVEYIGLAGGSIKGAEGVGGVAAYNNGAIKNCYNTGSVTGISASVGGITGLNGSTGIVTGCYNTGEVTGNIDIGGIVGYNGGTVTGCYNTGSVDGDENIGGIVGYNNKTVTGCYNTGTITGGSGIGGVAGFDRGTVTGCYNTGSVTGTIEFAGGITGINGTGGIVTGCYNTGTITGGGGIGGVAGYNGQTGAKIESCYNVGAVSGGNYTGGVAGWCNEGSIANCYNTGAVSGGGSYIGGIAGESVNWTTNCYNVGAVSGGGSYIGGVIGNGAAGYCYYDKNVMDAFTPTTGNKPSYAVGNSENGYDGADVMGLTTAEMTGTGALASTSMAFTDNTVWLTTANTDKIKYYPQIKSFTESADNTIKSASLLSVTLDMRISIETLVINPIAPQTYTGGKITPKITVNDGGTELIENTDYTVEYGGNINAGQASVTVTGIGDYKDTKTVYFTINKANGSGSVTITGWKAGAAASSPVSSSETNGTGNVTYEYKLRSADDSTYSTQVPTTAGEYTVRARFEATENYNEFITAGFDFSIEKDGLSVGAIAGIAVGSVVVVGIGFLLYWFFIKKKILRAK